MKSITFFTFAQVELRKLSRTEASTREKTAMLDEKHARVTSLQASMTSRQPGRSCASQTPPLTAPPGGGDGVERDVAASLRGVEIETEDDVDAKRHPSGAAEGARSRVRVCGVGGNARVKVGKEVEARTTGYSRHVNLSVKLNK